MKMPFFPNKNREEEGKTGHVLGGQGRDQWEREGYKESR
jgi:hypothetical protein